MPTGLGAVTTSTLVYIVPGSSLVGLAVSSVAGAACTRSIGRIFIEHFESGATLQTFQRKHRLNDRSVRSDGEARSAGIELRQRSRARSASGIRQFFVDAATEHGVANAVVVALGMQRQMPVVEREEGRAVADRHHRRAREPLLQQPVQLGFRRLVQRGRGLVQKQIVGRLQNRAGDAEALLLTERQDLVPVRLLRESLGERGQPDRFEHLGRCGRSGRRRAQTDTHRSFESCQPGNRAAAAAS